MNNVINELNQYYEKNLNTFGPGPKGVGWKNEDAQSGRFAQLLKIIQFNKEFTINDLGCGVGDLLAYLELNTYPFQSYHGYDCLNVMIGHANARFDAASNARFQKITEASEMMPADYTVASGIFNLKYNTSNKKWLFYIEKTIESMHTCSSKGFAFNILTAYSDKDLQLSHLFYADPLYFFDFCKRKYSKNVALLHDYDEYDFTILVRK